MHSFGRSSLALFSVLLLATCGGSDGGGGDQTPSALTVKLAPPSSIQNGVAFPLQIQVVAADGSPVDQAGIVVTISLVGAGRTLQGTVITTSDGSGVAQFSALSLIGPAGSFQLQAAAPGLTAVLTTAASLTAGVATELTIIQGDSQVAEVAKPVTTAMKVRARDVGGNNVVGASLSLDILGGAGSLDLVPTHTTSRMVVTDGNGVATLGVWRMGNTAGANLLGVTVHGIGTSPAVTFHARGHAGPMSSPLFFGLLPLTTRVDTTYLAPFKVVASDSLGNPIAGVHVTFSDGGGVPITFVGGDGLTDTTGTFIPASLRIDSTAGPYSVHVAYAYASMLAGYASNAYLTAGAGPFSRVVAAGASHAGVRNGATGVPFRAVDRFGNRVGGIPALVAVISGGGTVSFPDSSDQFGDIGATLHTGAIAEDVVVRGSSPLAPDSSADVTVHVVAPTSLTRIGPDSEVIAAGDSIPASFSLVVRDEGGAPVEGVPVVFGGFRHDTSDAAGRVEFPSVAPLSLGNFTYQASSPWVPDSVVTWAIQTVVGPPARMEGICCGDFHIEVGTNLPQGPGVKLHDRAGYPVPGVMVHFATIHGTIAGHDVLTDSAGLAYPTDWVMDTIAGLYSATVSTAGLPDLEVPVEAVPGQVTDLVVLPGHAPEGFANERIAYGVTIMAHDRYGNAPPGRTVTLIPPPGGSVIPLFHPVLDSTGRVYLDGWNLLPTVGTQQLSLSIDTLQFQFDAESRPTSPFDILLRGVPSEFVPVFRQAAYQWRRRITSDIPDINHVSIPGGICSPWQGGLNDFLVDDLIIDVSIGEIDGPGGILGGAGPCFVRTVGNLPLLGEMQFDVQDLQMLRTQGTLDDVVLHEMGHVLGIGSMWPDFGVIAGAGTADPRYTGIGGEQGWAEIGGTGPPTVPVENTGGQGTADSHWRETAMPSELMTGYLSALVNPMSVVTIRSLGDLGYSVDPSTADAYTAFTAPPPASGRRAVRIQDKVSRPRFTVDANGKIKPVE